MSSLPPDASAEGIQPQGGLTRLFDEKRAGAVECTEAEGGVGGEHELSEESAPVLDDVVDVDSWGATEDDDVLCGHRALRSSESRGKRLSGAGRLSSRPVLQLPLTWSRAEPKAHISSVTSRSSTITCIPPRNLEREKIVPR